MGEDREWYEVHRSGASINDYRYPNEEGASLEAEVCASETEEPVCVVYFRRTEIRRYQRKVTVEVTDVGSVPTLGPEGGDA